jgi:hypothetical protein
MPCLVSPKGAPAQAAQAAKKATAIIPIVITRLADPVKTGLVPTARSYLTMPANTAATFLLPSTLK